MVTGENLPLITLAGFVLAMGVFTILHYLEGNKKEKKEPHKGAFVHVLFCIALAIPWWLLDIAQDLTNTIFPEEAFSHPVFSNEMFLTMTSFSFWKEFVVGLIVYVLLLIGSFSTGMVVLDFFRSIEKETPDQEKGK
jgi:hypothetical protein